MKSFKTVFPDGDIFYKNEHGRLHREDGPAVIWSDGSKEYWINGKRHREDGPALIWPDGEKAYYLYGKNYPYEEWLELIPNVISIKWREFCESN